MKTSSFFIHFLYSAFQNTFQRNENVCFYITIKSDLLSE